MSLLSNQTILQDSAGAILESALSQVDRQVRLPFAGVTYTRDVPIIADLTMETEETIYFRGTQNFGDNEDVFISDLQTEFASADFDTAAIRKPVHLVGMSASFNILELQKGAAIGQPVDLGRIDANRRQAEFSANQYAYIGTKKFGNTGLLNDADSISLGVDVAPAAWALTTTTAQAMLEQLNNLLYKVHAASGFTRYATKVGMSPQLSQYLGTRDSSGATGFGNKSILAFLKENNFSKVEGGVDLEFVNMPFASPGKVSANHRIVAYIQDTDILRLHMMPIQRAPSPIQWRGLTMTQHYVGKWGEMEVIHPECIAYLDVPVS